MLAALPGGLHARPRAFADQVTLELGQRPQTTQQGSNPASGKGNMGNSSKK
jgi:hypothetical protein